MSSASRDVIPAQELRPEPFESRSGRVLVAPFSHRPASASESPHERAAKLRASHARLLSLSTAVPENIVHQSDVALAMQHVFADVFVNSETMGGVFASTGIRTRNTARPLEWYLEQRGWPERSAVYLETAGDLFVEAANKALNAARCRADDVDTVVFISTTGIVTPSLDAMVHQRMGFRADIERVPVFGLGCAGGVSGLAIASRLAQVRPGSTVLMVTVELTSLAFRIDRKDKANLISSALFGDGAAACVLRAGEGGIAAIDGTGQHLWPNTLDVMGWTVDPVGLGVILRPDVPAFAAANLRPAVEGIFARMGVPIEDVGRFVCHPGGAKVVTAIERSFGLDQGSLDHERSVLRDHGNMSAPTVLFILKRVIEAGLSDRAALLAMGPGFTATCVSLAQAA